MMWKHIFGYGNTRVCLCQDTGAMNRLPTPGGVLVGYFVGVSSIIGRLSAAVGADLSCPHIRIRHVFRVCSLRIRWLNIMYL